ncbi:heparin lyase I family protein [Puniceicoccaceae bacterium K14]|nr:heparin lyase I family protein [Puniceicoccaceae bacterium K14]
MKKIFLVFVLFLLVFTLNSQVIESGFEDSSVSDFHIQNCCGNGVVVEDWGELARRGSKVAKFQWWEDNYQNNRSSRGVEATSEREVRINKEGWYGFSFWVNASGDNKFRLDSDIGIAQALANGGTGTPRYPDCPVSWTWILNAREDGLHLSHRYGGGTSTQLYLTDGIPVGRWVDMIFHMKWSEKDEGLIEVWVDEDCWGEKGAPTYAAYDIPIGLDCWEDDALVTGTHLKFGMYCHDTGAYVDGEKRVIYFDQVTVIEGYPKDAWYQVQPERAEVSPAPAPPVDFYSVARNCYVELDWSDNNEVDLLGYNVYRSYDLKGELVLVNDEPISLSSFIDDSVIVDRFAYYAVTAVDSAGNESVQSIQDMTIVKSSMLSSWDIGTLGRSGSVEDAENGLIVKGSGQWSSKETDEFHFAHAVGGEECEILVQVSEINGSSTGGFAGISIRDGLGSGSKSFTLGFETEGTGRFSGRFQESGEAAELATFDGNSLGWLRLVRSGKKITAYYAKDEGSWEVLHEETNISLGEYCYLGMVVSSSGSDDLAEALFDHVSLSGCRSNLGSHIVEAEAFSWSNRSQVDQASEGSSRITFLEPKDYYAFNGLDFGEGCSLVKIRLSNPGPETKLNLYNARTLDSAWVGTVVVPSTGSDQSWVTMSAVTFGLEGPSSLYLFLEGDADQDVSVNWFEYIVDGESSYGQLDAWRLNTFGTLANAGDAADVSNPDGDMHSNLMEYAIAGDALLAETEELVQRGESSNDSRLTLSFNRISDPGLVYTVEGAENFEEGVWSIVWESAGEENVAGIVTVEDTETVGGFSQRFLRLSVNGY